MHFTKEKGITKRMAILFLFFLFRYAVCCLFLHYFIFIILVSFIFFQANCIWIFSSAFQFCLCECWPEIVATINGTNIFQLNCIALYAQRVLDTTWSVWVCAFWPNGKMTFTVQLFFSSSYHSKIQARNNHKTLAWVLFHRFSLTFMVKCNCNPCILFKNTLNKQDFRHAKKSTVVFGLKINKQTNNGCLRTIQMKQDLLWVLEEENGFHISPMETTLRFHSHTVHIKHAHLWFLSVNILWASSFKTQNAEKINTADNFKQFQQQTELISKIVLMRISWISTNKSGRVYTSFHSIHNLNCLGEPMPEDGVEERQKWNGFFESWWENFQQSQIRLKGIHAISKFKFKEFECVCLYFFSVLLCIENGVASNWLVLRHRICVYGYVYVCECECVQCGYQCMYCV